MIIIELDGFSFKLFRKKIKNINLRIQRTGEIHVSAPLKLPLQVIHDFLKAKQPWIERHRCRRMIQKPLQSFETGDILHCWGEAHKLIVHESKEAPHIKCINQTLHLFSRENTSCLEKQTLISQWQTATMQRELPNLIEKWETIIQVNANQWKIRRMNTRWGSCHPIKKHISLNLRLIEKPFICLEYVMVHELVHLLEPSHNQRFYALMNRYMPQWKTIKQTLALHPS